MLCKCHLQQNNIFWLNCGLLNDLDIYWMGWDTTAQFNHEMWRKLRLLIIVQNLTYWRGVVYWATFWRAHKNLSSFLYESITTSSWKPPFTIKYITQYLLKEWTVNMKNERVKLSISKNRFSLHSAGGAFIQNYIIYPTHRTNLPIS